MASRYPTTLSLSYCYDPVHVVKDNLDIYVPCGKCNGCLLHKSNVLSQAIGNEIDASLVSIFFTLTYSNKYLPKLYPIKSFFDGNEYKFTWISDHDRNIRFDGVKDKVRDDHIIITGYYEPISVTNFFEYPCIPYLSKRDIQLFLKILRKKIYEYNPQFETPFFRYHIVGEIGPTTYRPHAHGVLCFQNLEISELVLQRFLYESWSMCDEDQLERHFCDSGARGYVSQYITCTGDLPRVFRENKQIRPYRLQSKFPLFGSVAYDLETFFEDVFRGTIYYNKKLERLGSNVVVKYPQAYTRSVFPKCERFSELSISRLRTLYGCIWQQVRQFGLSVDSVFSRFRQSLKAMDYNAARRCYLVCEQLGIHPDTYLWYLDRYYYLDAMNSLRLEYQEQERLSSLSSFLSIDVINHYSNVNNYVNSFTLSSLQEKTIRLFLDGFGYDLESFLGQKDAFHLLRPSEFYHNEVDDIVSNMVKTAKFNEITGDSPTILNEK